MTSDELKRELQSCLTLTIDSMRRMASIVKELEERGEDLGDLKLALLNHLRRIAHGQLSAAALVRFSSRPDVLSKVAALPLPDQERLASGDKVRLAVRHEGSIELQSFDPLDLTRDQLSQAFGRGAMRSQSEQVAIIESRAARPAKESAGINAGRMRVDKTRNGLILGRTFYSADEILTLLAQLNDDTIEETGEEVMVNTKIDSAYAKCLKVQAAKRGTTMRDLLLRACRAYGLLSE